MVENFDKLGLEVVVDYEHASLSGSINPAAGWIKKLYVECDEMFGEVEWTKEAYDMIKNGEYKYISPVYNYHGIDRVTGADLGVELHSVALTNTPFLRELGEVKANKKEWTEERDQMISLIVSCAIDQGKINKSQIQWAMNYSRENFAGFRDFLSTSTGRHLPNMFANNMFANTNGAEKENVVELALKHINKEK